MQERKRSIITIIILLTATISALASTKLWPQSPPGVPHSPEISPLMINGELTRDKIGQNSDGTVGLVLKLSTTEESTPRTKAQRSGINCIVIIDRSGSMEGDKIQHAKEAIKEIASSLLPNDKLGLVSYSDNVRTDFPLLPVTPSNLEILQQNLNAIFAGGGTNLSAGLYEAIDLTEHNTYSQRTKIILISDGMANQGLTQPQELAQLAHKAIGLEASVSTVGVGLDFNEYLMTTIADHGGGSYHFLESPEAFAATFQRELLNTAEATASGIEIFIPEMKDVTLTDASGYPMEKVQGGIVIRPGNMLPGDHRKLFLTFKTSNSKPGEYTIEGVKARYNHRDSLHIAHLSQSLHFASVKNDKVALASINKDLWREKVMQDDLNKLRGQVAQEVKDGKKEAALRYLEEYKIQNETLNRSVSDQVAAEAEKELTVLTEQVQRTFEGTSAAISQKQKKVSKTLQHQGYEGRRDLKK